MDKGDSDL